MATGWLRGTVKSVESGDTLVIIGAAKIGGPPPPEKRLTLSSLVAPKLVRGQQGLAVWGLRLCTPLSLAATLLSCKARRVP